MLCLICIQLAKDLSKSVKKTSCITDVLDECVSAVDMAKKAFLSPLIACIFWCHFCHNTGHYVLIAWLPTYFDSHLGIHGSDLSLTCIPYLVMTVVVIVSSSLADRLIRNGQSVLYIRRCSTCIGFSLAGISLCMLSVVSTPYVAITLLCVALACNGAGPVAGYEAAKLDIIHPSQTGKLHSLSNTFATLSGLIGIPAVAFVNDATGSWGTTFAAVGLVFLSAAAGFYKYGKWKGPVLL